MSLVLQVLAAAQAMEKAGLQIFRPHGVTVAQFNILNLLAGQGEGLRASELAAALIVDPSNITGLLNRMNQAGYLKESKNPKDGRQRVVALSPKGRRLWEQTHLEYQRRLKAFEAKISEHDRRVTEKVLVWMANESASFP
jgi:DNA-binding MarR family transcriptional regulator